jgi:hypothetical protein
LTILQDINGYLGGYLVTNLWGRPLEFRLSSAVQPNRLQQILYGDSLQPYLCADLIGKTLVDRTATAVQYILTDREAVLDLRQRVEVPVAWLVPADVPAIEIRGLRVGKPERAEEHPPSTLDSVCCHPHFHNDVFALRELFDNLGGRLDLAEPFARIREAIGEARKMGVMSRA